MRYLLEVAYKGNRYAGSQAQSNAHTIQSNIEDALAVIYRKPVALTGSSRTDAGVHARQNFYHFDAPGITVEDKHVYNLNAILPNDIVVKSIRPIETDFHARFQAVSRLYHYHIYQQPNPFRQELSWYYPFTLDFARLQEAAAVLMEYEDFTSFSKRNTQAHTRQCHIMQSQWVMEGDEWVYQVRANRFLRGMVRALVATMLQVGRGKITIAQFRKIIEGKDCTLADFSAPPHGLYLQQVSYPD
jgi:tRNA pseudouridine38-40 synthase